MNTYTALLHDGTVIPIEDGTFALDLITQFDNRNAFMSVWSNMNESSLQTIEIQRNDVTVCTFYNNVLTNIQIIVNTNGTYSVHFYLKENGLDDDKTPNTYTELLAERVAALEEDQVVQDGAIEDLGMAISDIAEGRTE